MIQHSLNLMFVSFSIIFLTINDIRCLFAQPLNYEDCGVMPLSSTSSSSGPSTSAGHHPISLISGGHSTEPNSNLFPWMARLAKAKAPLRSRGNCGATIVGNRWLLTASHCVWSESERYKVGVGSPNLGRLDWKQIQRIHKYPVWKDWIFPDRIFDIALLELPEGRRLELNERVRKICLSMCYPIVNGERATVMGWADQLWNEDGVPLPNEPKIILLRYGTIELGRWGTGACYDNENPWYFCGTGNSSEMLLTIPGEGDSGGPVVIKTEKPNDPNMVIYYQIGIISMAYDIALSRKFNPHNLKYKHAIYLAVDHFCEWIRITTKEEVKCQMQGRKIGA